MNTCPNCGLTRGVHSSILPGCMCQYEVKLPQKKEWVGLTKEEAREICVKNVPYVIDMVAALEAKLKEKNSG